VIDIFTSYNHEDKGTRERPTDGRGDEEDRAGRRVVVYDRPLEVALPEGATG
jgi:hypothetical protein